MKSKYRSMPAAHIERPYTTEEFAEFLSVKPQSVRKRLSKTGSYHGARPRKAANGRWYWQPEDANKIISEA